MIYDHNGELLKRNEFNKISLFNDACNEFQYGVFNNGILTQSSYSDYDKYWRLASPSQFEKQGGGTCWDFTAYEADFFKNKLSKTWFKTIYIMFNKPENYPSHTFLVFKYDDEFYYFESAYQSYKGIYWGDSESDIIDFVMLNMRRDELRQSHADLFKYTYYVCSYNANDKRTYGMNCTEFMNYMVDKGTDIDHKLPNPKTKSLPIIQM